jgi:large subunit ribosomal protein L24
MKIKKNDTVYVIAGKDKKTTGKVLSVDAEANKIKVEGVCVQMKHRKARKANETSGIVKVTGSIDASNVMVVCPACNAHTRVGYSIVGDKKIRVCKKCGKPLDVKAEAKKAADKAE